MAPTTNQTAVQREPARKVDWSQASMGHRSVDDAWMARWAAHRAHMAAHPDHRTRPAREF